LDIDLMRVEGWGYAIRGVGEGISPSRIERAGAE